jgi:hypothetical protein
LSTNQKNENTEQQGNDDGNRNKSEVKVKETSKKEEIDATPLKDTAASKYNLPILKRKDKKTMNDKNKRGSLSREAAVDNKNSEDRAGSSSSQYFANRKTSKSLKIENKKKELSTKLDITDIVSGRDSLGQPENKSN